MSKDNHDYDLVNRNNVTGQTVKDANHISPLKKCKRASPQKSGRAYLLIKKKVKPKRCKRCKRAVRNENKSGLCSNCFNKEHSSKYQKSKKYKDYTQTEEYKAKRREYFKNYRAKKKKEKYSNG
jgi:hypothetical protein